MKTVITVIGKDSKGIIAKVSAECTKFNGNIIDISQSVLKDYFAMIMLIDISELNCDFVVFSDAMKRIGDASNLQIHTMHEDIFNTMHTV